jgi:MoaA/NifB/PqqE/SkfB family radical SAM enzyme
MIKIKQLYKKLLRKIWGKTSLPSDFLGPETIRIYPVGYLCNHACPMCWRSNNVDPERKKLLTALEKKSLTIDEYKQIFETLPPNVQTVEVVGGGEPLMFNKINELIDLIRYHNLYGSLITNGVLLRKKIAQKIAQTKWENVRVSFHAATQKTYKIINGVDTYHLVIKNIEDFINIKDKKTKIGCLFVIQKGNYHEIYEFAKKMQKIGVNYVEFDALFPYTKQMKLNKKELAKTLQELVKVKNTIKIKNNSLEIIKGYLKHPNRSQLKINKNKYFKNKFCDIPMHSLIIDSLGKISPCCFLDSSEKNGVETGNLREQKDLWKVWNNKKYREIRSSISSGSLLSTCTEQCYVMLKNVKN